MSPRHGFEATSHLRFEAYCEGAHLAEKEKKVATCGHLHQHVTPITCVTHVTPRLERRPHPKLCMSNKSLVSPCCMQDAFCLSAPTMCEMRGSVEHTMFVRAHPCLRAHTCVCLVFLDYILAYCLVSGSAYLAGLLHSLDLCFSALYHTLISS